MKHLLILLQGIHGIGTSEILILAGVIGLIIGLVLLFNPKNSEAIDDTMESGTKTNKVINVTLTGGIIGFLFSSPVNSLNGVIQKENAKGWRVIQVIPAESGNIFLIILRLVILVLTLFLYAPSNGYYVIMEREIPLDI